MKRAFFALLIAILMFSCKKDNVKAGDAVELYLLKSYQLLTGKCQVDASLSILQDTATIRNQDILEYSQSKHQFKLNAAAIQKVKAFQDGTPFAVTVEKQVVYYGFFKPGISSSSCDNSITMDIDWTTGDKVSLKLGYPTQLAGVAVDDQRNNPKLLAALKQQGKLN